MECTQLHFVLLDDDVSLTSESPLPWRMEWFYGIYCASLTGVYSGRFGTVQYEAALTSDIFFPHAYTSTEARTETDHAHKTLKHAACSKLPRNPQKPHYIKNSSMKNKGYCCGETTEILQYPNEGPV